MKNSESVTLIDERRFSGGTFFPMELKYDYQLLAEITKNMKGNSNMAELITNRSHSKVSRHRFI